MFSNKFCNSYDCLGTSNDFTTNSVYERIWKELTNPLFWKESLDGFSNGSKGRDQNQIYALGNCFGENNIGQICWQFVTNADYETHKLCPYSKGAVIWFDFCQVKYWNKNFIGQINYQMKHDLESVNDEELRILNL